MPSRTKILNNRVARRLQADLGFFLPFLTTRCRSGRVRGRPLGHPGDFPRVWGGAVGVPILVYLKFPPSGGFAQLASRLHHLSKLESHES